MNVLIVGAEGQLGHDLSKEFANANLHRADLDGDGDFDLVTTNVQAGTISVLMNNGDGTFAAHLDYDVGDSPRSVFAADLDSDGDNDLAVANHDDDIVSVLLLPEYDRQDYAVHDGPHAVVAADFSGNGSSSMSRPKRMRA